MMYFISEKNILKNYNNILVVQYKINILFEFSHYISILPDCYSKWSLKGCLEFSLSSNL